MQKIERNEIHDEMINREDPNWVMIYSYVTALLKAEELPELGQIGPVDCVLLASCVINFVGFCHTIELAWSSRNQFGDRCFANASFQQPGYLADLISPHSQPRLLRSSTQKLLSVPPHNLDTAARRFSAAAPRLWNSLPLNCRTAASVNTFMIHLKTFVFDSA